MAGSGEWDLLIYYGTTLTSSRRCATRAEAVGEGKSRRAELERAGLKEEGGGAFTFTPREPGAWQVKVAGRGEDGAGREWGVPCCRELR